MTGAGNKMRTKSETILCFRRRRADTALRLLKRIGIDG